MAASVSAYVGLISAVQTLEQTHGKSKLYTTCLGDQHSQKQVQPPCHARVLKNTCKQVMSFAPRLNSMTTPVKSAQQFGSQTDQVWRQIKARG